MCMFVYDRVTNALGSDWMDGGINEYGFTHTRYICHKTVLEVVLWRFHTAAAAERVNKRGNSLEITNVIQPEWTTYCVCCNIYPSEGEISVFSDEEAD